MLKLHIDFQIPKSIVSKLICTLVEVNIFIQSIIINVWLYILFIEHESVSCNLYNAQQLQKMKEQFEEETGVKVDDTETVVLGTKHMKCVQQLYSDCTAVHITVSIILFVLDGNYFT